MDQIEVQQTLMASVPYTVVNNREASRFEVDLDGELAVLEYTERAHLIDLRHTEVPPALAGHGVGGALAAAALEYANQTGKRVVPSCPFVRAYMKKKGLIPPEEKAPGD
ncbi:MAG: acetyltransferase [Gemmatimonadetes bacterium]|nr:acetyltransferase [Gemmatimonadota bacterium]